VFLFGENWACFFLLRDFVGLVEWYIENKVDGLFAVCQSSEMLNVNIICGSSVAVLLSPVGVCYH
jgi:hypothetical protein